MGQLLIRLMSSLLAFFVVSIFADLVLLYSSSNHLGYVAPELCKWVALRTSSAATKSSAAATKSCTVTPSDTRPSTPTGNLTTKGGASKPPTGESARTATPNLGEKPTKKLSTYETERNENIACNRELLAQLDLQPGVQQPQPQPQPKEKVKRPRKVTEPVPESERRRGRSAGQPSTMYVHFHFHYVLP
jgi:hypothetical protein